MWRLTEYLIVVGSILLGAAALFFIVFFLYKFLINQRLKGKFIKLHLPRISSIIIAFVILTSGGIGGFFLNELRIINNHKLYAEIGLLRAENAQYVPDIAKLSKSFVSTTQNTNYALKPTSSTNRVTDSSELDYRYSMLTGMNTDITLDNYNDLIEMIGHIDSPYNREFTVMEIKEEVKTVFDNIQVFDKWVGLNDGELSGQGYYKLSYNESSGHVTVIRKSAFQPNIWDREKNEGIWNGSFPEYYLMPGQKGYTPNYSPITEDIIYKIDYYFKNGIEVVECEIITVCHNFEKDYIISYQYLKNIKDTSFTKYIITPHGFVASNDFPSTNKEIGYDLDSNNPYGTRCQFIQMDYTDADDIRILSVEQIFSSAYNAKPNVTSINLYAKKDSELILYNTMFSADIDYYIDYYSSRNGTARFIYKNMFYDLVELFTQNTSVDLSLGSSDKYNADYKSVFGSEIKGGQTEIIYKSNAEITIYNNFEGDSFSGVLHNKDKLTSAYGYLEQSLTSLASNVGVLSPQELLIPVTMIKDGYAFENNIQGALEQIAIKATSTSYFANNYKAVIKDAAKYIFI